MLNFSQKGKTSGSKACEQFLSSRHNRCLSTPVEMYDREVTLDARRRRFSAPTKISFRRSRYIRSFAVVKFYFSGVQGALYTCALSQTGIRYRVRHLDITGDDRDAATGGRGGGGGVRSSREAKSMHTQTRCSSFKFFCGSPTGQRRAAFCAP
jgi:hypothetical protein